MKKTKLILMRHGQSEWNRLNLFTGWIDVPLSVKGVEESVGAGKAIAHLPIDVIYTSALMRAQMTAMLAMLSHQGGKVPCIVHGEVVAGTIPVYCTEALNERMYGELQGLNKQETREKFGAEQVHIWRRSFDQAPPGGESLERTAARAIPYFQKEILPHLQGGRSVLVAAHGNSLRAIVMFLDRLSKEEVVQLEIATGESIIYTFEGEQWARST